jgi:hypothetical protein
MPVNLQGNNPKHCIGLDEIQDSLSTLITLKCLDSAYFSSLCSLMVLPFIRFNPSCLPDFAHTFKMFNVCIRIYVDLRNAD